MLQPDFPVESLVCPALVPGVGWSDHLSFWRAGYAGVMVMDTPFYRYPYYHVAFDTPGKISYTEMAEVVLGLARATLRLAELA